LWFYKNNLGLSLKLVADLLGTLKLVLMILLLNKSKVDNTSLSTWSLILFNTLRTLGEISSMTLS
jgi:hypothetical protein